jgi:hypothetical protein
VIPLTLLPGRTDATRVGRDRLELLTALIEAPGFDPVFRDALIFIPPQHPVYAWQCAVEGCERIRRVSHNLMICRVLSVVVRHRDVSEVGAESLLVRLLWWGVRVLT